MADAGRWMWERVSLLSWSHPSKGERHILPEKKCHDASILVVPTCSSNLMYKHFHYKVFCICERSMEVFGVHLFHLVSGSESRGLYWGLGCPRAPLSQWSPSVQEWQRGTDLQQPDFPNSWKAAVPPVVTSPFHLLDSLVCSWFLASLSSIAITFLPMHTFLFSCVDSSLLITL